MQLSSAELDLYAAIHPRTVIELASMIISRLPPPRARQSGFAPTAAAVKPRKHVRSHKPRAYRLSTNLRPPRPGPNRAQRPVTYFPISAGVQIGARRTNSSGAPCSRNVMPL